MDKIENFCNMCGQLLSDENSCEAHLFPEWTVKEQKEHSSDDCLLSVSEGCSKMKRPNGVYDPTILCRDCDNKIGIYDGAAKIALLSTKPDIKRIDKVDFLTLRNVNADYIQLFALSLLWRSHISDRPEARNINLGIYGDKFVKAIKDKDQLIMNLFPVTIFKVESDDDEVNFLVRGIVSMTSLVRSEFPANYYEIFLPRGFIMHIKVDKRKWDMPSVQDLTKNGILKVPILKIKDISLLKGLASLIQNSQKNARN